MAEAEVERYVTIYNALPPGHTTPHRSDTSVPLEARGPLALHNPLFSPWSRLCRDQGPNRALPGGASYRQTTLPERLQPIGSSNWRAGHNHQDIAKIIHIERQTNGDTTNRPIVLPYSRSKFVWSLTIRLLISVSTSIEGSIRRDLVNTSISSNVSR